MPLIRQEVLHISLGGATVGDTLSTRNDEMGMKLRLDLRIIAACSTSTMEVTTGEFARTTTTNESKLFKDKLKSVLATKVHLNHTLTTMPYMPAHAIKSIKVPIIQIMGLNCYVYSLAIIDKGVYCLRDEGHFVYPGTFRKMKNRCMATMLEGLDKLNVSYPMDWQNAIADFYIQSIDL
ncbi:hypothetical protein [Absidia glauca]|uniref:Uncharacterized protein n=1 Tax=Absidia glauca TaxID=4829 RepID=A0A168LMQ3_ABSGL|nr:hypothetical protein [Absidia glauca]